MIKVLLLGVGMQGKAALHDLVRSGEAEVVAADRDLEALKAHVESRRYDDRVEQVQSDLDVRRRA